MQSQLLGVFLRRLILRFPCDDCLVKCLRAHKWPENGSLIVPPTGTTIGHHYDPAGRVKMLIRPRLQFIQRWSQS